MSLVKNVLAIQLDTKTTDPEVKTIYLLEQTLDDNRLRGKPGQIFNMDASGIPLDPKAPMIVAQKGTNVYTIGSSNKSQVAIVACVSAA